MKLKGNFEKTVKTQTIVTLASDLAREIFDFDYSSTSIWDDLLKMDTKLADSLPATQMPS